MTGAPRAAPGAADEFEALTLPWLADVRRYAFRLAGTESDADDLVQTTYLNALRGWRTFQPGSDARKGLCASGRNAFLRSRRRPARVEPAEDAELEALAAARESGRGGEALAALERQDLGAAIDAEIARLSDAYREVVALVDVEGLSYEEAAAALEVPIGTVRSRLYRARRLLQQRLIARAEDAGLLPGRTR